ncbi:regulatory protein RecX [Nocardioides agariphilus]|uniref:Regulatory protein RecX n=1 Tax=Nocardioides agariphilus TaxID=433664 RepID=A0A930VGA8_9ACTN|nr:regulatory protein RecX [Nocardioides agariphilus]MBF4766989.1 regulatory protein RecX [Nocardioides agariphilus]
MTDWRGNVETGVSAWLGGDERPASHNGVTRGSVRGDPAPEDLLVDVETAGPDADPESVARKILLDQLTGRARTRSELADKLRQRRVPEEIAIRLLDRFTEVGLVDDAAFARQWVESRQSSRGLARRALADELRRKGVDAEVVREAVDEVDAGAEEAAARTLVRKKLPSLRRVDSATATRRLVAMLARKGYPPGLAFAVVREELGAVPHDDAHDDPHDTT